MEGRTHGPTRLIVLDTSVIVSAALRRDTPPRRALDVAVERGLVALSQPLFSEIIDVLTRRKFFAVLTDSRRAEVVNAIASVARWFAPTVTVTDCRDPNDNKYLELALEAAAAVLISSDRDLLDLDQWRGIRIISPATYLSLPPVAGTRR